MAQKIEDLRSEAGLTQEQVAYNLGLSRQTYMAVEQGKREPSLRELEELAQMFNVSLVSFFSQRQDERKFKQMYFYILSCFDKVTNVTKTKLAKLLYLVDFSNFYDNLESMSGVNYICREYGPVADIFLDLTDELYENGEIDIDVLTGGANMIIKSNKYEPEDDLLSEADKQRITKICRLWQDKSTQEIVNFTHEQKPWKACRIGEYIPYELIIQENPDHVYQPVA